MNEIIIVMKIASIRGWAGEPQVRVRAETEASDSVATETVSFVAPMGLVANSKIGDPITVNISIA